MSEIKKVLLFCLGFVFLYNLIFFHVSLGLGFGLVILIVNSYFSWVREPSERNLILASLSSFTAIALGFLYAFRANEVVRFIDFDLSIFFSLTALYLYKLTVPFDSKLPNFVWLPLKTLGHSIASFFKFFDKSSQSDETTTETIKPALLRGVIIMAPIFLILLLLLVQADPIFGKLAGDLFSSIGERAVISGIIFIGLFAFGLTKVGQSLSSAHEVDNSKSHELSIILGSIILLFTSFIVIQFRYLFASVSESDLAELGIKSLTFSEYINKGFFELLIVAAIACGVIIYAVKFIHKLKSSDKLLVQILSSTVAIETILILVSDLKRLALYEASHGLTRARVFGFVFLVWLFLMLALLLWRVTQDITEKWFLGSVVVVSLLAVLSINIVNIDGIIASDYPPTVNGETDYYYLTSLSTDASFSWQPALLEMTSQINQLEQVSKLNSEDSRKIYWARATLNQLNDKINYLKSNYGDNTKWQSLNFSESSAYQLVTSNQDFNNLNNSITRVNILDSKIDQTIRETTPIDRSISPPLAK